MQLLTARRAIREHCIECAGSLDGVKACRAAGGINLPECTFFPHRLGRTKAGLRGEPTVLVRRFCLDDCCGGNREAVESCADIRCNLYFWRMGRFPEPPLVVREFGSPDGTFTNRKGKVLKLPRRKESRAKGASGKGDFHNPKTGGESS